MRIKIWTFEVILTDVILTVLSHKLNYYAVTDQSNDYFDVDLHNLTRFELNRKESDFLNSTDTQKENEHEGKGNVSDSFPTRTLQSESYSDPNKQNGKEKESEKILKRELEDAFEYGLKIMQELVEIKEPQWYKMDYTRDDIYRQNLLLRENRAAQENLHVQNSRDNFVFLCIILYLFVADL